MKKLIKTLSVILVVVIASMAIAQPAMAKTEQDTQWQYDKAIQRLEPFLYLTDTGNIGLNPPPGVVKSIAPDIYLSILSGVEQTNLMIDQGYLTVGEDFSLTMTESYLAATGGQQEDAHTMAIIVDGGGSYGGVTKVVWYWWGFKVYLSHYNCVRLEAGLGVAAAVCAMIPEPLASKVVAIIMASLIGTIMVYDMYDTGVIIRFHYLWIVPGAIIYTGIWSQ